MTYPTSYCVWVEGVNFDSTLFDTSDLSTIRGGSLALLTLGDVVGELLKQTYQNAEIRCVIRGASKGSFVVTFMPDSAGICSEDIAKLIRLRFSGSEKSSYRDVYRFLSVVVGVAPVEGKGGSSAIDGAMIAAQSEALKQQMKTLSISGLPGLADMKKAANAKPCAIDGARPAEVETGAKGEKALVSNSVLARREYGRDNRQNFYKIRGAAFKASGFCNNFEEIIANPPDYRSSTSGQMQALPESVRGKIAVFYADGNKFGSVIDRLVGRAVKDTKKEVESDLRSKTDASELFSNSLRTLQDGHLLKHLVSVLENPALHGVLAKDGEQRIRFETLLWGGDELMFVMPAWLALPFASAFFDEIEDKKEWEIGGIPLTFSAGLVFANHKTPIRQLKTYAEALANAAKAEEPGLKDRLAFDVLESLEPPMEDAFQWRKRALGIQGDIDPGDWMCSVSPTRWFQTLSSLTAIPRSQIYNWLQYCRREKLFECDADPEKLEAEIKRYTSRIQTLNGVDLDKLALPRTASEAHGWNAIPKAAGLYILAQLWDYLALWPAYAPEKLKVGEPA